MKKRLLFLTLGLALLVIVGMSIYRNSGGNPRQQILGKWHRFSNDASVVTFFPNGKLVVHYERWEADITSRYEFIDDSHLQFTPGASMLSGDETNTIQSISNDTMYLQSKKYGIVKYCRDPKNLFDSPAGPFHGFKRFWRAITGQKV